MPGTGPNIPQALRVFLRVWHLPVRMPARTSLQLSLLKQTLKLPWCDSEKDRSLWPWSKGN